MIARLDKGDPMKKTTRLYSLVILVAFTLSGLGCSWETLAKVAIAGDPTRTGPSPFQSNDNCKLIVKVEGGIFNILVEVKGPKVKKSKRVSNTSPTCEFSLPCGGVYHVYAKIGEKVLDYSQVSLSGNRTVALSSH